jgi:hypothetical protein
MYAERRLCSNILFLSWFVDLCVIDLRFFRFQTVGEKTTVTQRRTRTRAPARPRLCTARSLLPGCGQLPPSLYSTTLFVFIAFHPVLHTFWPFTFLCANVLIASIWLFPSSCSCCLHPPAQVVAVASHPSWPACVRPLLEDDVEHEAEPSRSGLTRWSWPRSGGRCHGAGALGRLHISCVLN